MARHETVDGPRRRAGGVARPSREGQLRPSPSPSRHHSGHRAAGDRSRPARAGPAARRAVAAPRPIRFSKDGVDAFRTCRARSSSSSRTIRTTSTSWPIPMNDGSRSGRRGDAATARCRIRAGALPQPRDGAAQRPAVREPMELPRHRHGARVGHPARRDEQHRRGRARQRHGVSLDHGALQLALPVPPDAERSALSRARPGGRALCRRAGARRERVVAVRRAARLHLERRPAGRSRRPRHARGRHDRPADQQQQRHRGHGLQRPADAGEDHPGRVGRDLLEPVRRHRRCGGARHPLRRG